MPNRTVPPPTRRRRLPLRRCSFRFVGRPESVKDARDWLARRLAMADAPEETAETALLLLSELATNNVVHAPADAEAHGDFYVRVFFFYGWLRVEVRDAHGRTPSLRAVTPDVSAESGRGLLLVNALASRWGRFQSGQGPGMFFELRWELPRPLAPVVPIARKGR